MAAFIATPFARWGRLLGLLSKVSFLRIAIKPDACIGLYALRGGMQGGLHRQQEYDR
jgi:hypothetical protein